MTISDVRAQSLWLDQFPGSLQPRPSLDVDVDVDVAIVGGGFTGLWTAYYLNRADPSLRICVVEREVCGFGASGRNGGWAVGELAGSLESYAKTSSMDAALRQLRAVFDAVDEIGRVAAAERIDCGYAKGGTIRLARNEPQAQRQRAEVAHERSLGITEDEFRLLSASEASEMANATNVQGGIFLAPSAALDPARLVRGLADRVADRGVSIYEQTEVIAIDTNVGLRKSGLPAAGLPGAGVRARKGGATSAASSTVPAATAKTVRTRGGTVTAEVVVRATEAYTRDLPGERRTLVPFYSLMVATEPMPESVFDEIGLAGRPTFADDRHMVIYGQRTQDNRIAFGGRAVPYSYASRIDSELEKHRPSHEHIETTLTELFPVVADYQITHRWGGVLGVPRNWMPSVQFDRSTGLAAAGGYVGEGVAAANLAGRTLADLIVGNQTDRTALPWVGPASRKWEPEPLRWLGVRGSLALLSRADAVEDRTQREARWATKFADFITG